MASLRPEEEWARELIARSLGVPVEQHDDSSRDGMYDLVAHLNDGCFAAVEVTAAADGESIALWKLMHDPGERWIDQSLAGGWMVSLEPSARGKRLRRELPRLLGHLESQGISNLRLAPHLRAAAVDLGVVRADQGDTNFPGSIYITIHSPPGRSGGVVPSSGDGISAWVATFLSAEGQRDVRAKLESSGLAERHAFVLVPGFPVAPFEVIDLLMRDGAPLPVSDPSLPAEVTHVWLASTWSSGSGFRWSPTNGWSRFDKVRASAESRSR